MYSPPNRAGIPSRSGRCFPSQRSQPVPEPGQGMARRPRSLAGMQGKAARLCRRQHPEFSTGELSYLPNVPLFAEGFCTCGD
jgi:hypothetical protein